MDFVIIFHIFAHLSLPFNNVLAVDDGGQGDEYPFIRFDANEEKDGRMVCDNWDFLWGERSGYIYEYIYIY